MKANKIEQLFKRGQHQQALDELRAVESSPWSDVLTLRCLRALGHKNTVNYADQLRSMMSEQAQPYAMNKSERNNLLRYVALIYSEKQRAEDACDILAVLCEQNPNVAALHREYALALTKSTQFDKAQSHLYRAIELQPNSAASHKQLGQVYCRTGRIEMGCNSYARAATLEPNNPKLLQKLLFWSNYSERATQRSRFQLTRLWVKKAFSGSHVRRRALDDASAQRLLNIAFVSSNFSSRSIKPFLLPLLEDLNRSEFQIYAYNNSKAGRSENQDIKVLFDGWLNSSTMNDAQLIAHITADKIDILIDLDGHKRGNRLTVFSELPAPIQMSWLGCASTLGLNHITCRITDRIADPTGPNDQFYSETLLRLPNGLLCYKPLDITPEINVERKSGPIRFGSFNKLATISNTTLDCWASALLITPNSTLTIINSELASDIASTNLLEKLSERGISKNRIKLNSEVLKLEHILEKYNEIDIALDSSPYNDTPTVLEALWMGVPVISLSGDTYASRIVASILHRLDLNELSTNSVFEFSECAKRLSENPQTLIDFRTGLRKRIIESALTDKVQFSREFGHALRLQWQQRCHEKNALVADDNETSNQ